jgi:phage gp37-like protein
MSLLLDLRAAIVTALDGATADNVSVEPHSGRFDEQELGAFLVRAPAIRVAVLGVRRLDAVDDGSFDASVQIGIYIATKDVTRTLDRDTAALGLVEAVMLAAWQNSWGLDFAHPAKPGSAQNLYNETSRGKGVALWAIDLAQSIRLGREDLAIGAFPSELWLGFAPNIGAANAGDYLVLNAGDGNE